MNDAPGPLSLAPRPSSLLISHASSNNLKNLSVEIPLGRFVCITGVSGSGKTTLLREVLLPALSARLKSEMPVTKASERLSDTQSQNGDDSESSVPAESLEGNHAAGVQGCEELGRVVLVDQSILGKTPRSNPAVYIGAFDDIREFFAQSEVARQRGLNASAFSFNSAQGQCERCRGAGFEKIEMQFLSDVFVRCPDCNGRRYRDHILKVRISPKAGEKERGSRVEARQGGTIHDSLSIADVLESTVDETVEFLSAFSESKPAQRARQSLSLLQEVGLGYLKLGQPINTLSGGESQRMKLVRHLAEVANERHLGSPERLRGTVTQAAGGRAGERGSGTEFTGSHSLTYPLTRSPATEAVRQKPILFLFDEPTTGLHFDDVRLLLNVFQQLVDACHSVLVIEHNLEVIKSADWIIDLGPEAGDQGGQVVVAGTPETVAQCPASHTGAALREVLF